MAVTDAAHAALHDALGRVAVGTALDPSRLDERTRRALDLARDLGAPAVEVLRAADARAEADADATRALRRASAQGRAVALGLALAPPALAPLLARLVAPAGTAFWASATGRVVLLLAGALWLLGVAVVLVLLRRAAADPSATRSGSRGATDSAAGGGAVTVAGGGSGWLLVGAALAVSGRPLLGLLAGLPALRAGRPVPAPGRDELLELACVGLRAGLPLGHALRRAGGVLPHLSDAAARLALWLELGAVGEPPCLPDLAAPLARTHRLGAPVLPVAERLAAGLRAAALQRRLEAAERLPVQLTVPTTLLLLPAALLVVLAPVLDAALAPLR